LAVRDCGISTRSPEAWCASPIFALQIRRIAARQPLPGYRLRIERGDRRELLRILPVHLSTVPVDSAVENARTRTQTVSGFRTQPYRDFARTNRS